MKDWNPKYSGESNFKKKNHFKLKDAPIVARILPQPKGLKFGSPEYNATEFNPRWSEYHSVHFGYKNMEGKHRPFESPLVKNNKTKMIEVPDAALDRLNDLKAKYEAARMNLDGAAAAALNTLIGQRGVYNVDNNHHMNVILLDGSIGELKLRYKAKLALDNEIKRLRTEGVEPLSFDDGRFFVFTRSGLGKDTTFTVSVYTEKLEVKDHGRVDKPVSHKVTPEILARLETEGFDLTTLFNKPSGEEVAQIVAESDLRSGKSPACDRVFDAKWKAAKAARVATGTLPDDGPQDDGPDAPDAAPQAPSSSYQPTNGNAAAQTMTPTPPGALKSAAVDDMSDSEFFKTIGVTV